MMVFLLQACLQLSASLFCMLVLRLFEKAKDDINSLII